MRLNGLGNFVTVATVDSSQGSESDVVIVSFVRSGLGGVGFLEDARRINVGLTRARKRLVCVGDLKMIERGRVLRSLVGNIREREGAGESIVKAADSA